MKTTLISIGNSRGVRIPKPIIEECGLKDEVEMDVRGRTLVLHAPTKARSGWQKAFNQMARMGDDTLIDDAAIATQWDEEDWQWK